MNEVQIYCFVLPPLLPPYVPRSPSGQAPFLGCPVGLSSQPLAPGRVRLWSSWGLMGVSLGEEASPGGEGYRGGRWPQAPRQCCPAPQSSKPRGWRAARPRRPRAERAGVWGAPGHVGGVGPEEAQLLPPKLLPSCLAVWMAWLLQPWRGSQASDPPLWEEARVSLQGACGAALSGPLFALTASRACLPVSGDPGHR